jgi:hypothetical protein
MHNPQLEFILHFRPRRHWLKAGDYHQEIAYRRHIRREITAIETAVEQKFQWLPTLCRAMLGSESVHMTVPLHPCHDHAITAASGGDGLHQEDVNDTPEIGCARP